MAEAIFIADIVEHNGKTVRQNNLETSHNIPLKALVEISYEGSEDESEESQTCGLRLFVVEHSRDFDGTPLYSLSTNKKAQIELNELEDAIKKTRDPNEKSVINLLIWKTRGSIITGYPENALIQIVKPAEGKY